MADKNVNIKITAESKEAEKSLNKITAGINKLGKSSTVKSVARLSSAVNQSMEAFGKLKDAIGEAVEKISECVEAYTEQRTAELALQQAAKNNPYLDNTAVQSLKDYAVEMSKLSGIADEELLPAMAQLATAGRTESEIMKVVSAACDISASGAMSFESAVSNLGKTFNGSAGALADMVPAVSSLTKEQMAAGEAVDIIAASYKGMASAMGEVSGGAERLKNAVNTMKEEVGAAFTEPLNSVKTFFATVVEGWADALGARRRYRGMVAESEDVLARVEAGEAVAAADRLSALETTLKEVEAAMARGEALAQSQMQSLRNSSPAAAVLQNLKSKSDDEVLAYYLSKNEEYSRLLEEQKRLLEEIEKAKADAERERAEAEAAAAEAERLAAEEARRAAEQAKQQEANDKALAARATYDAAVAAAQKEIDTRRELGEEITRLAELEEMRAVKVSAAISMIQAAEGTISYTNPLFTSIVEDVAAMAKEIDALQEPADDTEEKLEALREALEAATPAAAEWRALSDTFVDFAKSLEELRGKIPDEDFAQLEEEIKKVKEAMTAPELEGWQKLLAETEDIYERAAELELLAKEAADAGKLELEEKYLEEVRRLNELAAEKSAEAWDVYTSEIKEKISSLVSEVASNLSSLMSTVTSACDLLLETAENRLDATLDKLEIAYLSGQMDEEEYNEAVLKAKKEAAQAEYKIEMWEWSASLLTATANIAEGVTKAIAQGGVAGIVSGALVSAAGAVQLASIIASKPTPPTYSTGGIVGGTSYTGDKVQAMLNSGEMVLNAGQQRNLFDSINSGNIGKGDASGQSNTTQVLVNNSAANIVSAQSEVSEGQVKVMIDARVNESMRKGRYNKSLTQAEQLQSGKWYGS